MQSTVNGTVTTTAYIGTIEEVQTSGNTTQTTTYYSLGGKRIAAKVNSTLYYFGYDALGSQVAVLNTSGSVIGSQLYGPYGSSRYSNGTLPTSIGFTGQRADSVTGLDYYNARYYDPVVGRFMAADTVQGNGQGMDPYGYVGGNPETRTDPTGKRFVFGGPGETYDPSACGSCIRGGGGTVVSTYVPPPYDVQIRNNQPMTKPTTKPTQSGNGGGGGPGENPKIVTGGNKKPPLTQNGLHGVPLAQLLINKLANSFDLEANDWQGKVNLLYALTGIAGLGTFVAFFATGPGGAIPLYIAVELAQIAFFADRLRGEYSTLHDALNSMASANAWDEATIKSEFDDFRSLAADAMSLARSVIGLQQDMATHYAGEAVGVLDTVGLGTVAGSYVTANISGTEIVPQLNTLENEVLSTMGYQ